VATSFSHAAEVSVECIAHSCFVVRSRGGTELVIDPFNSHTWLGYSFPAGMTADAVLISHPHFDHDASYYIGGFPLVLRRPGSYSIGDVCIHGLEGRHGDPLRKGYGDAFGKTNTVWLIETDGLMLAHLGDNGPLDPSLVQRLREVDVLMLAVDSEEHVLTHHQVEEILRLISPRIAVPMHYVIPSLAEAVADLGPVEPWLEGRANVHRLPGHRLILDAADLPEPGRITVFQHSPAVRPWSDEFRHAMANHGRAMAITGKEPEEAAELLRRAVELHPHAILLWRSLADLLLESGRVEAAKDVLERSLGVAGADDWWQVSKARLRLGQIYERLGATSRAVAQYHHVLRESSILQFRETAESRLKELD